MSDSKEILQRFKEAREKFTKDLGVWEDRVKELDLVTRDISLANHRIEVSDKAILILEAVATTAQNAIHHLIDDPVTVALRTVYEDASLSFATDIERSGDRMELTFRIQRGDEEIAGPILDSEGGGLADVVSFTLRICLYRLLGCSGPIVLDEPFRHMDEQALPRVSDFVRQVSDKMGIQIIAVSHSPELTEAASNVIRLTGRGVVV